MQKGGETTFVVYWWFCFCNSHELQIQEKTKNFFKTI